MGNYIPPYTIAKCNTSGNSNIFIEFMLDMIDQVLDDVILQVNKANAETSEYVKKMLDLMEYDIPYTSNDIMAGLGLKSKETLRKNYINPAIELGMIRLTNTHGQARGVAVAIP